MSSTVLLGQTSDSVKCFTAPELRKIATSITEKNECKELLEISNKRLEVQDSLIGNYREQIAVFKAIAPLKDTTVIMQEIKINNLQEELKKTKKYWTYSSIGLFTLVLLLIL